MKNKKVIAIDFDDTITEPSPFPITGRIRPEAVRVIKKLQEKYICCLWTCRTGAYLKEALQLLEDVGLHFEYINQRPQEQLFYSPRKMVADYYIDDRVPGYVIDWALIEKTLL